MCANKIEDVKAAFPALVFKVRNAGQTGLLPSRLLLTQHFFAVAAVFMLRCSLRRGSGRSQLQSWWISGRPFAASCSSSHIADKAAVYDRPFSGLSNH